MILDHLTPPLTRAETYGPLKDLEALVDEYYEAAGVDRRRLDHLKREIRALVSSQKLDVDAGITPEMDEDTALQRLDTYLCELKESQIRDGLHVFGASPVDSQERDLAIALARVPRGDGRDADASLIRALAADLGLTPDQFDPLDCTMGAPAPECAALATYARSGPAAGRVGARYVDAPGGSVRGGRGPAALSYLRRCCGTAGMDGRGPPCRRTRAGTSQCRSTAIDSGPLPANASSLRSG